MHEPIAYVYEADHHCEGCALDAFGRDEYCDITGIDGEGNEVGVIAPWDDDWYANDILPPEPSTTTRPLLGARLRPSPRGPKKRRTQWRTYTASMPTAAQSR